MVSFEGIAGQPPALGGAPQTKVRLSGVVVTTDETPLPVRRAIVSLSGGRPLGYHTVTDDDGRFEFDAVPAGRYELSAARKGFVTIAYGATRPGRPGTPLSLEPGRNLTNVRVLLARGGVVTGTVRDYTGGPVVNLEVRVERHAENSASRSTAVTVRTDDQGMYRAFGLAAGKYFVSARPAVSGSGELSAPSEAEVNAALHELQQRRLGPARSSGAPTTTAGDQKSSARAASSVSHDLVPVYYPSAFTLDDAAVVTVLAGEERADVDITLRLMRTSAVSGRIQPAEGRRLPDVHLTLSADSPLGTGLTRTTPVRSDGTFIFTGVAPGRYLVAARAVSTDMMRASLGFPPLGTAPPTPGPCAFAVEDVSVTGTDVTGLSLSLRPCLKIAGRLEFDGQTGVNPPSGFASVRVVLEPDPSTRNPLFLPPRKPAAPGTDGRFVLGDFGDVLPGAYHLRIDLPDQEPGRGWTLESATADGRDILDSPLELRTDSPTTTNVVFTFTDRHTSLTGVLYAASGRPAVDYTMMAFTTNRAWWRAPFRRVRTARPATNGEYLFQDLPPGEYYLAALSDLAPDNWRDPEFLSEAVGAAVRMTIGPGEQRVQNLRIGGGG